MPLIVLIILRMGGEVVFIDQLLGTDGAATTKRQTLEFLYTILCGSFIILIFWVVARKAITQEKLIQAQYDISEQNVINDAILNLSNTQSVSARLGGIAGLYDLAKKKEHHREKICAILCSHIRVWTQENHYQKQYEKKPSGEIQSVLDMLTHKDKNMPFRDIKLDLTGAWLAGAYLVDAQMRGAILKQAQLQKAAMFGIDLRDAELDEAQLQEVKMTGAYLQNASLVASRMQKAVLSHVHFEKADLDKAQLQGADLYRTQLQESILWQTNLQGAYMWKVGLEGAEMWKAKMQGAHCSDASMQGVDLDQAELQGADLTNADLRGADLNETQLQGAILGSAQLQGAYALDRVEIGKYHKRMRTREGKETEINTAIFAGGISIRLFKRIGGEIQQAEKNKWIKQSEAKNLLEILKQHHDKEAIVGSSYDNKKLTKDFKVSTGLLTKEAIEEILKEDQSKDEKLLSLIADSS